jgi:hypothetical protein
MRIGRSIIIPAILALSAAGSILAGSAVPVVAQTPAAAVVVAAPPVHNLVMYHYD